MVVLSCEWLSFLFESLFRSNCFSRFTCFRTWLELLLKDKSHGQVPRWCPDDVSPVAQSRVSTLEAALSVPQKGRPRRPTSRVRLKEGSSTDLCMHPEAERLDSCQLFIRRARRRVAQAQEKVSKAQEELSKFGVELASAPWPASRLQPDIKRQHQQDLRKKSPF